MSAADEYQYDEVEDHRDRVEAAVEHVKGHLGDYPCYLEIAEAAEDYASRKIPVIPLYGIVAIIGDDGQERLVCECANPKCSKRPGKHPRIVKYQDRASTNAFVVAGWWRSWPLSNVGILTGPGGIGVVIDLDPRNGSEESLVELDRRGCSFPETTATSTGGGGQHLIHSWPTGLMVGQDGLPALKNIKGIDVKGRGGLIVAPPSRHQSGGSYQGEIDLDRRAQLPQWSLEDCPPDDEAFDRPEDIDPYPWAALMDACRRIRTFTGQKRRNMIRDESFNVGRLVPTGGIDRDVAANYLCAAGERAFPDKDPKEVERTVLDALADGEKKAPRRTARAFANRPQAMAALDEIRQAAWSVGWSGHQGKRTRSVLVALIEQAEHAGGPGNFAYGTRSLTLKAGLGSFSTVTRAVRELRETGWLFRITKGGEQGRSSTWRLRIPPAVVTALAQDDLPILLSAPLVCSDVVTRAPKPSSTTTVTTTEQTDAHSDDLTSDLTTVRSSFSFQTKLGHDAWRDSGIDRDLAVKTLGKSGWACFELLTEHLDPNQPDGGWLRKADMATRLGIGRTTVHQAVTRLEVLSMAETRRGQARALPLSPEVLDRVAVWLGTAGMAERQRRSYGWTTGQDHTDHAVPARCHGAMLSAPLPDAHQEA